MGPLARRYQGAFRRLSQSMWQDDRHHQIIDKCMDDWRRSFEAERIAAGQAGREQIEDLVEELFDKVYERKPSERETAEKIAEETVEIARATGMIR